MSQTSSKTDPSKHQAILEYMAGDAQSRGVVIVHIPFPDGDPVARDAHTDTLLEDLAEGVLALDN